MLLLKGHPQKSNASAAGSQAPKVDGATRLLVKKKKNACLVDETLTSSLTSSTERSLELIVYTALTPPPPHAKINNHFRFMAK